MLFVSEQFSGTYSMFDGTKFNKFKQSLNITSAEMSNCTNVSKELKEKAGFYNYIKYLLLLLQ